MTTRSYRAFSTELLKIATEVADAEIRKLLAERRGEEYLPGGQLPSNTQAEAQYMPKFGFSSMTATQFGATSPIGVANKRNPGKYQESRDLAYTGLKGAMGGVGASGLGHALAGVKEMPTRRLRAAAGIGTGIALADHAIRHHEAKKQLKHQEKQAGIVSPGVGGAFRSAGPADSSLM